MAYYSATLLVYQDIVKPAISRPIIAPTGSDYFITFSGDNFISLHADVEASRHSGKLQVATMDGLSIIDLSNKNLYDRYTYTVKGRSGDTLVQEDIVDTVIGG